MIPANYAIPNQYSGDTLSAIQITCTRTDVNDVTTAIDLTNVNLRMDFKKSKEGAAIKSISDGAGITKTDATNGILTIDSFLNLDGGNYIYDLEFTYADGTIHTYLKGTYTVIEDITQ